MAGLPAKPYTDANYLQADKNVQGFNNALQWAYENGYRMVIVPTGSYAICYPRTIMVTQSNMTFDFGGSTLKVIYDSTRKSPFDTRTGVTDFYNFPGRDSSGNDGVSIKLQSVTDSHIRNLILIGDKADRSFTNSAEAAIEWTYGIQIVRGSSYCSVRNCTISSYMGDGISLDSTGFFDYAEFALGLTVNDINRATGAVIPATGKTLVSQLLTIPTTGYSSFLVAGAGYSRQTAITNKEVDVAYYAADNTYLGYYSNKKIYTPISIPPEARKFRFLFNNETNTAKNMQMTLKFGLTPHHNTIEYNEVYNLHRGGITLGGNYNIVQHNSIHDGTGVLDRKPIFPDPTRYGINQEDSYGDNCVVRNNLFYNLFHGALIGCWTIEIHNNHFYNLSSIGINLYSLHMANVRENYLYRCQTGIGLMDAHLPHAHVNIEDNTIAYASNAGLGGTGYDVYFYGNTLIDTNSFAMADDDTIICRGNHFVWTDQFSGIPTVTANRVEQCSFEGWNAQREFTLKAYEASDSVFTNLNVRIETRNGAKTAENVLFRSSAFTRCILNNHQLSTRQRQVQINGSKLTDTVVKLGNINTPEESPLTTLNECDLYANTITYMFQGEFNTGVGRIEVNRCRIIIANSTFAYLLTNVFNVASTIIFSIKRSTLTYTGTGRLNLQYYNPTNKRAVRLFATSRNILRNINPPAPEAGIVIEYDPDIEGLAPPTDGVWFKGDIYGNAAPSAGGNVGWVCVSPGPASDIPWRASAARIRGDRVFASGRVYEAMNSGTSGTSSPAWPIGSGSTVSDGTVTWQEVGPLAYFRAYGTIF
ncbi:hypothetical protein PAT3040_02190 [Paenibacillus agaridevorans]|uniref:Periplasmic copper-binding protein NosD beta helix domain-containing protein n=2 Tax=Paenibacillus agaridevorans TaxID=171404 RepID=A0A2R5EW74_9BACL|nr:hypothetical protein PAT3040_02190 [Paenibacillus agaridevorans]